MILVTGAAGHLGNVLTRELLSRGERVRALILPGEDCSSLEGLELERAEGDVLDPGALDRAFFGIKVVYHLAGIISILPGKNDLLERVNVQGTWNVLEAARQAKVRRLVYTSSIHALSRLPEGVTIDETLPFDPDNPAGQYDQTKAKASLAVLEAVTQGLDAVIVCPTGIIGPFDYRMSEMGKLIRSWMLKRFHLIIEGNFDFVDVRDVATGEILACEKGKKGEVYILSGERVSLVRLMKLVQKAADIPFGGKIVPLWLARFAARLSSLYCRLGGTAPQFTRYSFETVMSNSRITSTKAEQELGYQPRPFALSAADTVAWWKERLATAEVAARSMAPGKRRMRAAAAKSPSAE